MIDTKNDVDKNRQCKHNTKKPNILKVKVDKTSSGKEEIWRMKLTEPSWVPLANRSLEDLWQQKPSLSLSNWDIGIVIRFLPAEDLRLHQGSKDIKRKTTRGPKKSDKVRSDWIRFGVITPTVDICSQSSNLLCESWAELIYWWSNKDVIDGVLVTTVGIHPHLSEDLALGYLGNSVKRSQIEVSYRMTFNGCRGEFHKLCNENNSQVTVLSVVFLLFLPSLHLSHLNLSHATHTHMHTSIKTSGFPHGNKFKTGWTKI